MKIRFLLILIACICFHFTYGQNKESQQNYVDPENVDKRRAEVGLGPLSEYVGHWDMTWDIEKHKANTAKIEAAEK